MHGLTTIAQINRENAEAAEIMKAKGFELPKFESGPNTPQPVHVHIPLGATPEQRTAIFAAAQVNEHCAG